MPKIKLLTPNTIKSKKMKECYKKIDSDKYKITSWNENLIEMKLFLSFLTINVERSENFLGQHTGWTQLENSEHKLIISGGNYNGVEYLNIIQYGTNLDNIWNNVVNPFYLFDILNEEGKKFFLKYYENEIEELINKQTIEIENLNKKIAKAREFKKSLIKTFKPN